MSITGWRAREFSSLLADLGEGLDDLGVPEGQPFLISPAGVYDVALNRYFSVWLASSPWNTQAAHVRDLRTYFDFLWFARGRRDWRDAPMDDRAAFEWWGGHLRLPCLPPPYERPDLAACATHDAVGRHHRVEGALELLNRPTKP
ncbi:hypothetical protein ACWY4P_42730 [Streptomyces sp. LZ34]|uniref:hypothetical protein n=1 Tax=Nonomuraea sp. H19 TaxID=3452206 RepID=UPI003F8CC160